MTGILILLLLLLHSSLIISTIIPKIYQCQVESYTTRINIRECSNIPISIKTTRCRGQCYSEDSLIYDWQYSPKYYRHKHYLHCCTPNNTIPYETSIMCQNKQRQIIKYQIITQCMCKLYNDNCLE